MKLIITQYYYYYYRACKDFARQSELRHDEFFPPCYLNLMECVADLWSGLS